MELNRAHDAERVLQNLVHYPTRGGKFRDADLQTVLAALQTAYIHGTRYRDEETAAQGPEAQAAIERALQTAFDKGREAGRNEPKAEAQYRST